MLHAKTDAGPTSSCCCSAIDLRLLQDPSHRALWPFCFFSLTVERTPVTRDTKNRDDPGDWIGQVPGQRGPPSLSSAVSGIAKSLDDKFFSKRVRLQPVCNFVKSDYDERLHDEMPSTTTPGDPECVRFHYRRRVFDKFASTTTSHDDLVQLPSQEPRSASPKTQVP